MIAAMAKDRVIGKDNDMPWHLPADLKHFKAVTLGKPVIMGRRTLESIGRALPGRQNIVITRDANYQFDGVDIVSSPEEALAKVEGSSEVMIIGGGKIYEHFLEQANTLYLTFIDLDVAGDTRFPDYNAVAQWQEIDCELHEPDEKNRYAYKFVTLSKLS